MINLLELENKLLVLHQQLDNPSYDFDFATFFQTRQLWRWSRPCTAIARVGAPANYHLLYQQWADQGVYLINTPFQHQLASDLTAWYPLLEDLTPRSRWYDAPPTVDEIEQHFDWPVFLKGQRQTSRHQAQLSIVRNADDYRRAMKFYQQDSILRWQKIVVREFLSLRTVPGPADHRVPASFEFRTFYLYNRLIAVGPYWTGGYSYTWTAAEQAAGLALSHQAAQRLNVPFLVVDLAQDAHGQWHVIECNDAQESGPAGIGSLALWNQLLRSAEIARFKTTANA